MILSAMMQFIVQMGNSILNFTYLVERKGLVTQKLTH